MNHSLSQLYEATRRAYLNFANYGGKQYDAAYTAAFNAQMREIKAQGPSAIKEYESWVSERLGEFEI